MRALDGDLRRLYAAQLLWSLGFGLYNYLWPLYATSLGADGVALGLLFGLTMLVNTLVALPGGWLADRCDRRRVIVIGWWVAVPSAAVWALAGDWRALIPGVLLYNGSNILLPAMQAYVAERAPAGRVASTFTLVFSALPLGLVVSPELGGYLAARWGLRSLFWCAFVLFAASALVLHGLTPQRPAAARRDGRLAVSRQLQALTLLAAAVTAADTLAWPFFPALLQARGHAGPVAVGWYGALVSLSAAVAVPLCGRLAERLGAVPTLVGAQVALAGASALLAAAPGAPAAVAPGLLLRGSLDGSRTLLTSLVSARVPRAWVGRAYGYFGLVTGLAGAVAPYAGGWLYRWSPTLPFWVAAPLILGLAAAAAAVAPRLLAERAAAPDLPA